MDAKKKKMAAIALQNQPNWERCDRNQAMSNLQGRDLVAPVKIKIADCLLSPNSLLQIGLAGLQHALVILAQLS